MPRATGSISDGLVVGSADKGARNGVALRWTSRKAVELPSLGGPANRAIAVNADGVVVGFSAVDDAGDITHAVRWVDDKIEDLGTLGGDVSQATAINRDGVIVGSSTREDGFSGVDHAFRWMDGSMSMLGRLGRVKVSGRSGKVKLDRSIALGLNDQGEICGSSISASENDPVPAATLWIGDDVVDVNALIGKTSRDRGPALGRRDQPRPRPGLHRLPDRRARSPPPLSGFAPLAVPMWR